MNKKNLTQNCALNAAQHSKIRPVCERLGYILASDAQFFLLGASTFSLVVAEVLHVQQLQLWFPPDAVHPSAAAGKSIVMGVSSAVQHSIAGENLKRIMPRSSDNHTVCYLCGLPVATNIFT